MNNELAYHASPSLMTQPGDCAYLFDSLSREIAELCSVVQGSTIHIFWAKRYGMQLPDERKEEVQLRSMQSRLAHMMQLDTRPLSQARPLEKRLVGNCRDFSVMLTAILRHQGVPARARCGFGAYFLPDHFEDHWVCEYWNVAQKRWVLVDAQLDEFQCKSLHISFDPLDVPRDQFIVGGKAWQMCQSGQADPEAFGIFDMHGLWFVRGNLVRDVASLNKVELLPWDSWGIIEAKDEDLSEIDMAFLDHVADLSYDDVQDLGAVRALSEDDRLHVPSVIRSYTDHGVQSIEIAQL